MPNCPAELKMGSDQRLRVSCVLCKKSDENDITGPLSSKEDISAHQNCLLFSSGIYCKNSPTYDDLFGFAVQDVKNEQRRGKRLICHHCKKNGATAGCDLKRCMRSYHYPCAIEASARAIEDITKGSYKLLCKRHDPESKRTSSVSLQGALSSFNGSKRRRSADSHGRRSESNSSTGSSEVSLSRKKSHYDIDHGFAPVESDVEEYTPPTQHNQSTPYPERKWPCDKLNPSGTGSLNGELTSDLKARGSTDNPGELHGRSRPTDSMAISCHTSPEVETPRGKKKRYIVDSDDESPIHTDPVVAPVVSDLEESVLPEQPNFSTPVPENTRTFERLSPSTTGADDDDTEIDSSEESQSLLQSEMHVPCNIIMDSGPSAESEYSVELGSPVSAAPENACPTPGFVAAPEHEETPSTSRTSPVPRAPTTDPVSLGGADSTPARHHDSEGPSVQPGSPQHSRPSVDIPMMVNSTVQTLSASDFKIKQQPEPFPPAGVSTSPNLAAASDVCDVNSTGNSQSNSSIFWTRCNQAGWTKEIFSELASHLSSLGERVQSQEASYQDYDVALNILEASGCLPCIITQLEQDLKKQEQDLQRKKAALRDARAVLGV
ncbi:uncharacterized protein phf11 [Pseudorasbora parva]|uniref:uncharacterized protein phf11 n=1 Tax=Pseudorasbora parva TaxID=51549 RepID=UPI00351F075D